MLRYDQGWPLPGLYVRPLAVTPDGRVWMQYESEYPSTDAGLCWYDGTNVGTFPAPPGGVPQWGGLPHAGIGSLEVRVIPDGYELWMSCISRGLAVLTVHVEDPAAVSLGEVSPDIRPRAELSEPVPILYPAGLTPSRTRNTFDWRSLMWRAGSSGYWSTERWRREVTRSRGTGRLTVIVPWQAACTSPSSTWRERVSSEG